MQRIGCSTRNSIQFAELYELSKVVNTQAATLRMTELVQGVTEVLCYGTAVVVTPAG